MKSSTPPFSQHEYEHLRDIGWSDGAIALLAAHALDPKICHALDRLFRGLPGRPQTRRTRRHSSKKQRIPSAIRKVVFERDAYRCVMCGDWHDLTVDHIVAESRGGTMDIDNLQTLCRSCNSRKGAR